MSAQKAARGRATKAAKPSTRPAQDGRPKRAEPVGRAGTPAQGRELRARGQRTMRRLLDGGIDVFSTRGFHAARVDDIVKAAHTSHGTFYLYFSSKEDLFQALVADVAEQMAGLAGSLGPITADADGYAELRAWLVRFTELYEHYGPILRTWTEAEIDASEMGRLGTDLLGEMATALNSSIAAPTGDGIDPTIASLALVAMVERFNYFVQSEQVDARPDQMLDTLTGVMHEGLFGTSA
ncbi:MAG: TetR/AcrR family transcriptional regulator [Actinobacteria bacterium]|nr:TetR/AcrR family transcriptional regulator [Actinomycetota bacterium]